MRESKRENPFRPNSPVWQPGGFFGRSRETRRVLQSLRNGQSVSIVGPPKCGKTWLLNYVADIEVFQRYALLAGEHIFVHIDVVNVEGHSLAEMEQDECFFQLREEIIRQIRESNVTIGAKLEEATRRVDLRSAHFGLHTLFRTAHESGLKPIVALDNFDMLAINTHLAESFFQALRFLATGHYWMAYLVASRHPLHELERVRPEASTFFGICHQIVLEPFAPKESRELVTTTLEIADIRFPTFVIAHILKLGCNEPYRLQLAGYHAFEMWRENDNRLREADCGEIERCFEMALRQSLGEFSEK
jgi:AAA+ ATPase superfamily predicted ATPase